ncbi:hypothetical protein TspCOW1_27660 [Thiohalobacter sp. COW1]|uniref:DUF4124 domain-containing protein n=1 Tax=Thiohalobacter thiocyanaticus TaxID=585455 RepID=A0A1Z4VUT2_9GAMM|nr:MULTISPECIES: DUF4124 domain-containing protein [Thiohalobacter]BAZ95387.1 uncharacterized protein FOKN1_3030 [Thiohalobacter thiocyanaticus]BCO32663.1 hypothetical protein TspCOW1_27660 [Thiohalobacter sp. COW1]
MQRFTPTLTGRSIPGWLLLALMLALLPLQSESARLYKWVDEQGNVHYGDKVPPEYSRQERKVLNDQGVQVDTLEAAKTPEQIAEERRLEEIRREEERKAARQRAHDRMLLSTFTTEDDMIMTRDGKIAAIDSVIRITRGRIDKLEQEIEQDTRRAANLERAGRAVPKDLDERIAGNRERIQRYEDFIESKQAEQEAIRRQFEADIRRFRELRAMQDKSPEEAVKRR